MPHAAGRDAQTADEGGDDRRELEPQPVVLAHEPDLRDVEEARDAGEMPATT